MAGDSSELSSRSHSSSSRYDDRATCRFKAERDETRHELEIISKEVGIAELEWEHQRKQLLEAIDGESCNLFNSELNLELTAIACDFCKSRRRAQSAEGTG
jgi:hypothetical protein